MKRILLIGAALCIVLTCAAKEKVKFIPVLHFYAHIGWHVAGNFIVHNTTQNHTPVPKFQLNRQKYRKLKAALQKQALFPL